MPNNWKTYKLGDIAEVQTGPFGTQLHQKDYVKIGTPIITVEHLGNNRIVHQNLPRVCDKDKVRLKKYWIQKGDIIFSRVGSVDRRAFVTEKEHGWLFSGRCLRVRANEKNVDGEFLSYYFGQENFKDHIRRIAVGATMPSLNTSIMSSLQVEIPKSLQEQQGIASILSAIDDKIENNLAINKTLEEMAMALYKHWFVDFGPFQDGEFVESELGMIPKGWEVKRLDEIAYKRSESYKFKGKEKVVFVNTSDVLNGSFMHKNYKNIDDLPGQAKKSIYPEDILFSEIRPINRRFAYVDFNSEDYVVSTKFMVIRNNELINNKLLYRILTRDETILEFQNIAESRSGTFPQITFDVIGHVQFSLPAIGIQNEFQELVGNLEEQQKSNLEEIKNLTQLRDTLLPSLISGEVRLKEFQEQLATIL
jgi:type I restriction enzyme S subunit